MRHDQLVVVRFLKQTQLKLQILNKVVDEAVVVAVDVVEVVGVVVDALKIKDLSHTETSGRGKVKETFATDVEWKGIDLVPAVRANTWLSCTKHP